MMTGLEPVEFQATPPYDIDTTLLDILKTTELRADIMQQERDEINHKYSNLSNQVRNK